jgi:uncharacterized protein (DUF2164 family)
VSPRGEDRESPMRVRLSDDRKAALVRLLREYFEEHFDEPVSDFRAEGLIDFFVKELGPPVYNQGVRDACAYMQGKLTDVEGEVYEPETPARG